MDLSKGWRDGWRQKDEVDDEEETEELLSDRDLCGKEMTAEDVDSFIWAEWIDVGIGNHEEDVKELHVIMGNANT